MRLGGIYIDVAAKTAKLKRDLAKAETMSERAALRMQHHISNINFRAVGVAALAFGATVAFGMKKAIDAASDLEETTSKFNVVFAGQAKLAEKNAQILNESFAMSREEAMRYLASVQDLLVPMGVASEKAAQLSGEVVKLSADLGSFNNMPTERVMLDIQSALVGNFETMKKYGVVLKETVVAEKALAMGLADTKKELTAGDKAQAAYALMVEGSAAAVGDMARTSESYANQTKKLNANISDLTADIGKELLPLATEVVKELNLWLKANDEMIKQDVVGFLKGVTKAIEVMLVPLKKWAEFWQMIGWVSSGAKGQMPGPEALPPPPGQETGAAAAATSFTSGTSSPAVTDPGLTQTLLDEEHDMIVASLEKRWVAEQEYAGQLMAAEQARVDIIRNAEDEIVNLRQRSANMQRTLNAALFTTMLQVAGVSGKKLFLLQKAWQIGSAVASAFTSANLAMATIPPPQGEIVAAARLKAGLLNAKIIAATAVGQLAAGGGSTGGGTYTSPTVTTPADLTEATGDRGTLTINIQGDIIGDEQFIDELVERINEASDRDVFINQSNYAVETL